MAGTLNVETSSPLSHPLILSSSQMLNCVKGMVDLVTKMLSYRNSYVIRFLAWDILKSLTHRKSSINGSSTGLLMDPTLIPLKQITVDMFFKKIHPIDFIPYLVHLTLIQSVY